MKKGQQTFVLAAEKRMPLMQENSICIILYIFYTMSVDSPQSVKQQQTISEINAKLLMLKSSILNLDKNPQPLPQILSQLKQLLKAHPLDIVIFLHHSNILLKLLQHINLVYQQHKNKDILEVVYIIYTLGFQWCFKYDQKYLKMFKALKAKAYDLESFLVQIKNFKKQKAMLFEVVVEIKRQPEAYEKGLDYNQFIEKQLPQYVIHSAYDQIFLVWLKKYLQQQKQQYYKQKKISNVSLCCHLQFQNTNQPLILAFKQHEYVNLKQNQPLFERQTQIVSKDQTKYQIGEAAFIKRTIVYFLNNRGGFIYLGFNYKNRQGYLQGVPLSRNQRLEYLKIFTREIVVNILPYVEDNIKKDKKEQDELDKDEIDKGRPNKQYYMENDQEEKKRINFFITKKDKQFQKQVACNKFKHELCNLITLQFVNIYDRQTLLFSRVNDSELYIIRITIKMGYPTELYYIMNGEVCQAYVQDANKPLSMLDFVNKVYVKMKDVANGKYLQTEPNTHNLCIQSLKTVK